MSVTRHQHQKQILLGYSLRNLILQNGQSAIYIGTITTDNMDRDHHISEISSKVTKTLGFLRRNFAFALKSSKKAAYKTLVQLKLEHASSNGSPYSISRIIKLRKFRGRQPTGPAGDGETQVVSAKCLMPLSGHLWGREGLLLPASLSKIIWENRSFRNKENLHYKKTADSAQPWLILRFSLALTIYES